MTAFESAEPGLIRVPVRAEDGQQAERAVLGYARSWFGPGFPVRAESCQQTGDGAFLVRLRAGQGAAS